MRYSTILQSIGNTPHVRVNRLFGDAEVWLKLERANPAGSIKDRAALAMIEAAERDGTLAPGGAIVEPTSGNTGIALAMIAAVKGYALTLVMPDSMSIERRQLMAAYGARLELTPKAEGMKGAIARADAIRRETGAWMPQQFENPANPDIHTRTTAQEILRDFADEPIDVLVTGVGTGGHIAGVGRALKARWPSIRVYAVEPAASPVLGGGAPGPHPIQGIGAGFVPANYDPAVVDDIIAIDAPDAIAMTQRIAREEGILCGISTGATLAAIARLVPDFSDKRILGFNYDTGERYLSVDGFLAAD